MTATRGWLARMLKVAPAAARKRATLTSDEKRKRCDELLAIGAQRAEARKAAGLPPLIGTPESDAKFERVKFLLELGDMRRERIEAEFPEGAA